MTTIQGAVMLVVAVAAATLIGFVVGSLNNISDKLTNLEVKMNAQLQALADQVSRVIEVETSAVALIKGMADQIKQLVDSGADPAEFAKLADDLHASADGLAAAVAANTPAAPPAPTPTTTSGGTADTTAPADPNPDNTPKE